MNGEQRKCWEHFLLVMTCGRKKENERCLGSRLIAINNHSMEEVLNAYDRILSNETDSYLKYLYIHYANGQRKDLESYYFSANCFLVFTVAA